MELLITYNYTKKVNPSINLKSIRNYNKSRIKGPKKIICNAPFKHIYFNNQGNLSACCMTKNNSFGNIKNDSIHNIWNGEKAQKFRDRIQNYNLEKGCTGCKNAIEIGNNASVLAKMYDDFLPIKLDSLPTEMTFELSNICNLECTMCNGEFSNLIRKNREGLPAIDNPYDDRFFEHLKKFLPNLKVARFIGGEPFLINEYYKIWDYLLAYKPSCKIYIQTNGTVFNHKVESVLAAKNIEISISIDSLQKDKYEQIRKNANFDRTIINIEKFHEWATKRNKLININFCLLENNYNELIDIIKYCSTYDFTLNIIPVEFPLYSSMRSISSKKLLIILNVLNNENFEKFKINNKLKHVFFDTIKYIEHLYNINKTKENNILHLEEKSYAEQLKFLNNKLSDNLSVLEINTFLETIQKLYFDENIKRKILSRFTIELDSLENDNEFYFYDNNLRNKKVEERFLEIYNHLTNPNVF